MSAEPSLVQEAGASAPAVSLPVVRPRPGAELALALAASAAEDAATGRGNESHVLDAEKLTVYHVALELQCMANTLVPSVNRVLRALRALSVRLRRRREDAGRGEAVDAAPYQSTFSEIYRRAASATRGRRSSTRTRSRTRSPRPTSSSSATA